jgi:DNA-binding NarL/FixJ family response regulator
MRIVVAEDQLLLREGLVRLLESHGVEVVAAVGDSRDILPAITEHSPDLALLDIRLPPTLSDEGLVAAREIRQHRPGHPVVMLSQYVEQLYVDELLSDARGGVGYLLKDRVFDGAQFVADLRSVAAGGTVVDPDVVNRLLQRRRHQERLSRLTPREMEALAFIAEGDSNAQIAAKMVVTEKAVSNHINSLLAKLDLPQSAETSRRVLAVLTYLRS